MTTRARWATLLFLVQGIFTSGLLAQQVTYNLISRDALQHRLNLYKGNDNVRETALRKLFTEAGCEETNLLEQPVPGRKQPNVICRLPGSTPETIVVGAHFDHVSAGEGIIDNWSGASLLPSLFQSLPWSSAEAHIHLRGVHRRRRGSARSAYYADQLPKDQLARIEAMINLDTLALGPTEVWVSQSDPLLVSALGQLAKGMKLPLRGMDLNGFGESDEESFIRDKICTLTIHTLTSQTTRVLHHTDDNPSAVRFDDYYNTFHLLAAYLAVIDVQVSDDGHVCKATPIEASKAARRFPMRRLPGGPRR